MSVPAYAAFPFGPESTTGVPPPGTPCLLLSAILMSALPLAGAMAEITPLMLEEVDRNVYLHQGQTVPFGDPRQDDIANLSVVVGERCVAVIDTGGSVEIGKALRRAIRTETTKPICYVINTHIHPDHTLGNAAFSEEGVAFVGHARLPHAFAHNRDFLLSNYRAALSGLDASRALVPPDITVNDTLELDIGGRTLRLEALPPGHTDQDLSVFDAKSGTLWLGSLFVQRVPALDGNLRGWIDVTRKLMAVPAARVIPGNGPAPAQWPAAGAAQLEYLETLERETRALIARGGYLEQALETVGQGESARWLLFEQHHPANVIRAYTELEWE